jgi:uncharacterized protein DUF4383
MRTVQKFALYFGFVNLLIGIVGFIGPLVFGGGGGLINTGTGLILGVIAINPPHALLHLLYGLLGIVASRNDQWSIAWSWGVVVGFGLLALGGWLLYGFSPGIHDLASLAIDAQGNLLHSVWALLGLVAALQPDLGQPHPHAAA